MRLQITIIISLVLLSSCKRDIIPREKFTKIVAEIYLSDKYINSVPELALSVDTTLFFEPIFQKWGYTTTQFTNTIAYYVERPTKLKAIYLNARDLLSKELDLINLQLSNRRRADSLKEHLNNGLKETKDGMFPKIRAHKWIIYNEGVEFTISPPDTSAVNWDYPVSPYWWKTNFRQISIEYHLYEKDSSRVSIPDKFKTPPQGLRYAE